MQIYRSNSHLSILHDCATGVNIVHHYMSLPIITFISHLYLRLHYASHMYKHRSIPSHTLCMMRCVRLMFTKYYFSVIGSGDYFSDIRRNIHLRNILIILNRNFKGTLSQNRVYQFVLLKFNKSMFFRTLT